MKDNIPSGLKEEQKFIPILNKLKDFANNNHGNFSVKYLASVFNCAYTSLYIPIRQLQRDGVIKFFTGQSYIEIPNPNQPPSSTSVQVEELAKDYADLQYGDPAKFQNNQQLDNHCNCIEDFKAGFLAAPSNENSQAMEILKELCQLKHYKDEVGKDAIYEKRQPELWKKANDFLNSVTTHQGERRFTLEEVYEILRQVMFGGTPDLYDQGGMHYNHNLPSDHSLRRAKESFEKYYLKKEKHDSV